MVVYNQIFSLHEAHDHIWIITKELGYVPVGHDPPCILHRHLKRVIVQDGRESTHESEWTSVAL